MRTGPGGDAIGRRRPRCACGQHHQSQGETPVAEVRVERHRALKKRYGTIELMREDRGVATLV